MLACPDLLRLLLLLGRGVILDLGCGGCMRGLLLRMRLRLAGAAGFDLICFVRVILTLKAHIPSVLTRFSYLTNSVNLI